MAIILLVRLYQLGNAHIKLFVIIGTEHKLKKNDCLFSMIPESNDRNPFLSCSSIVDV